MSSDQQPRPSSLSPTTVLVAVAAAVVILIIGVLLGGFLRSGSDSSSPGIASDSISSVEPNNSTERDAIGVSDPDVTKWHDDLFGPIAAVVAVMTNEMPRTEQEVSRVCETLTLSVADLDKAPAAPKEDLESSYRAWVGALDEALSACEAGPGDGGIPGWIETVNARLTNTSTEFDVFGQTLDLYYDFDAPPPVQ